MKEKKLLKLMDKRLKISTLLTYQFKTNEIVNAINNMITNLQEQQWYSLEFKDYKKRRRIISKNRYKRKKNSFNVNIKKQQEELENQSKACQKEALDLSLPKQKHFLPITTKNNLLSSNVITNYQQDLNDMIEKQLQEVFSLPKNIFNQSSSYQSNFNDTKRHLANHPLSANDCLNTTNINQETYYEPISNNQKQITI